MLISDQASDGLGTVGLGSTSGTIGRLGILGQRTIPGDNAAVWQPYGRFKAWRDWGGAADTQFSGFGIGVPLLEKATRLEFAGGMTFKLNTNLSFYTQAGYQFAVGPDDTRRDGFKGDIGLRWLLNALERHWELSRTGSQREMSECPARKAIPARHRAWRRRAA
jgi:outer membrane autotransporter protein